MNESMKEEFDRKRARRQRAAQAMRRKAKLVRHTPKHMAEAKVPRGKTRPRVTPPTIQFIDLPSTAMTTDAHRTLIKQITRFYGQNNKYLGNGKKR